MLTTTKIKSALVSAIIMGIFGAGGYMISVGDIFSIDWRVLANIAILAAVTAIVSAIKSMLTTEEGMIVGIKIK